MIWTNKNILRNNFSGHRHDMHELFFCLNDSGVQYIEGEKCAFSRGRAFFLYSDLFHSLDVSTGEGAEFIFFCFDQNYFLSREILGIHELIQRLKKGHSYFSGTKPEYLQENVVIAQELHDEINHPDICSGEKITALLTCLIVNFSRSLADKKENRTPDDNSCLIHLCRSIRKKPEAAYCLAEAAAAAAMSQSKFSVKFKEFTGMTFFKYIIEFRLKKACRLLSDCNHSVLEAAHQSGFNNLGLFHRQFKRRFGLTPLQVKKKYLEAKFPNILHETFRSD